MDFSSFSGFNVLLKKIKNTTIVWAISQYRVDNNKNFEKFYILLDALKIFLYF